MSNKYSFKTCVVGALIVLSLIPASLLVGKELVALPQGIWHYIQAIVTRVKYTNWERMASNIGLLVIAIWGVSLTRFLYQYLVKEEVNNLSWMLVGITSVLATISIIFID